MAKKGDEPVTPERTTVSGSNLRSSLGKTSSSSSGEKSIPHYLRASTGSCHDLCKYGGKHSFEAKARLPIPRKVTRKSLEGESSVDSVVLPKGKKTTLTQAKAKFSSISRLSEPVVIRHEVLIKSPICQSPTQREVLDERKKKLLVKPRPLQYSRSHTANAPKILKQGASLATRNPEDSLKLVFPKAKEVKRTSPEESDKVLKPKFMKVKPLRSTGSLESSSKNKEPKMSKNLGTSKEATKKVVVSSTASLSSNRVHRVTNLSARKHSNLKTVPLKTHNKIRRSELGQVQSEEVKEKTLYVIKIENEEKPQQSDRNEIDDNFEAVLSSPPKSPSLLPHEEDHDESEYTESEEAEDDSYSEDYEFDNMEAEKTSSGSTRGRSHNVGMHQSKEEDPQSIKLNFRRGKIIDIHSENNSPRRLKFRRRRLLGENKKVMDDLRKNFKRGKEVDGDTNASETAPESVVLRHQDVQGKKDAQGLLNNVIEETASKLVETRKSKVKALVGAFETVISLQDGKPSLDTVT